MANAGVRMQRWTWRCFFRRLRDSQNVVLQKVVFLKEGIPGNESLYCGLAAFFLNSTSKWLHIQVDEGDLKAAAGISLRFDFWLAWAGKGNKHVSASWLSFVATWSNVEYKGAWRDTYWISPIRFLWGGVERRSSNRIPFATECEVCAGSQYDNESALSHHLTDEGSQEFWRLKTFNS